MSKQVRCKKGISSESSLVCGFMLTGRELRQCKIHGTGFISTWASSASLYSVLPLQKDTQRCISIGNWKHVLLSTHCSMTRVSRNKKFKRKLQNKVEQGRIVNIVPTVQQTTITIEPGHANTGPHYPCQCHVEQEFLLDIIMLIG